MDGFNGGWMYTFGSGAASATTLNLVGDEDQLWDLERSRATESAAYCVFQTADSVLGLRHGESYDPRQR